MASTVAASLVSGAGAASAGNGHGKAFEAAKAAKAAQGARWAKSSRAGGWRYIDDISQVDVSGGWCFATLNVRYMPGNFQASAWARSYGPTCYVALFTRRAHGRWHLASGRWYSVTDGTTQTGYYADGPGVQARACLLSDTLQEACTDSI